MAGGALNCAAVLRRLHLVRSGTAGAQRVSQSAATRRRARRARRARRRGRWDGWEEMRPRWCDGCPCSSRPSRIAAPNCQPTALAFTREWIAGTAANVRLDPIMWLSLSFRSWPRGLAHQTARYQWPALAASNSVIFATDINLGLHSPSDTDWLGAMMRQPA